jgi:starch phosphorylase
MAIHNTARVGKFSSDRTILEYAEKVWKLPQVGV